MIPAEFTPAAVTIVLPGVIILSLGAWFAWPYWLGWRIKRNRRRGWAGDRPRRTVRLPLPLLRALTWRKRRRPNRCTVLADHLAHPLSEDEWRAWSRLKEEIR